MIMGPKPLLVRVSLDVSAFKEGVEQAQSVLESMKQRPQDKPQNKNTWPQYKVIEDTRNPGY